MKQRTTWIAAVVVGATLSIGLAACAPEPTAQPPVVAPTPAPEVQTPEAEPTPANPENPGHDQAGLDSLLRQAAWANDLEAAGQLIGWGADVNAKDNTVQSAYLIATSEGHVDFLELMLEHGADVTSLDSWVGTGLIRAAERGHWHVVGVLLQAGVAKDHINRIGFQAIHEAVWLGRDDPTYHATIRVLVAGGVDMNTPSSRQNLTPLQMANQKNFTGSAAVLRALTEGTVPADATAANAALLRAATTGDVNSATLALRGGADPQLTDDAGVSVRELAEQAQHIETAQVIRALGG